MLQMIGGELRKLLSRRIVLLLSVLLCANVFMSIAYQKEQAELYNYSNVKERLELLLDIERARTKDPKGIETYYAELLAEYEVQYSIWLESTLDPNADASSTFIFVAPYTYSHEYNDYEAFHIYFNTLNNYPESFKKIIDHAKQNTGLLESLGIITDSKTGAYQTELATIYSELLEETESSAHLTLGWNEWFSYSYGMLIVFLSTLLLILQSGLCDRDSGMELILRVAKKGRWQRGFAKAASFFVALTAIVILMELSELAVFAIPMGLTSPLHAVQNVRSMTYCPYGITIITGALLRIGGVILSAFCFSMLCLVCTALLRNAFITIFLGGTLIAGNLILYWIDLGWNYQFLGVFSLASGELLLRCPDVAKIHMGKSLFPYALLFYLILTLVFVILLLLATGATRPKIRRNRQRNLRISKKPIEIKIRCKQQKRVLRIRPVGLVKGELAKRLNTSTMILLVILIILHVVMNVYSIRAARSDGEGKILSLIDQYGDRVTENSVAQMQARLDRDEMLIADQLNDQYVADYLSGRISSDEYTEFLIERAQAQAEFSILADLVAHSNYLLELERRGISTQLFYDGGYLNLLGRNFDIAHYLIIVLLCASTFASEYGADGKNGMAFILRSTKRGRIHVWGAKLGAAVAIAAVSGLLFQLFDFAVLIERYGTAGLSAPLICIERYADYSLNLSVGEYMTLYFVVRIFSGILLAVWIGSLSYHFPSIKLNLPIITAMTLLPMIFTYLGLSICKYFDFTALLDGDRALRLVADPSGAYLTIYMLALLVIVLGTSVTSVCSFCGIQYRRK